MYLPDIPDADLADMLGDDAGLGDLTTHLLGIGDIPGKMTFDARYPMVVACCEEAERILRMAGCVVERVAKSGQSLAPGAPVLVARGPAGALHRGWKVAQTLVEIASGMATCARGIVDAARSVRPDVAVVCTRKNVPGAKAMSIKAIMAGGATAHRLGLSETILVFDAHRKFREPVAAVELSSRLRAGAPEKKIMVEIESLEEGLMWAAARADILQADKMTPASLGALTEALRERGLSPLVSAAGGVNAANAADYVRAGAAILVTSAPYTAKPLDIQVRMARMG